MWHALICMQLDYACVRYWREGAQDEQEAHTSLTLINTARRPKRGHGEEGPYAGGHSRNWLGGKGNNGAVASSENMSRLLGLRAAAWPFDMHTRTQG